MPDRMIREGLKDSARVAQLSWAAFAFFIHLKLTVDDNGVHPSDPELLRRKCYPKRPQVRIADIVRWMAECQKADLIATYDADDGKNYLIVLRFGQKLKWSRGKYPLPHAGPPDAPGQLRLLPGADPPAQAPPPPVPPIQKKRSEVSGRAREARRPHDTTILSDDDWLQALADDPRWAHVDVRAEYTKCRRRYERVGRRFFEEEWLARCERPTQPTTDAQGRAIEPEPEGWRLHLKDAHEGEDWATTAASCQWHEMPGHWRRKISAGMKQRRSA